jgi:hypothetical protein
VAHQLRRSAQTDAEQVGLVRFPGLDEVEMVLQVFPDARQFVQRCDAVPGKFVPRSYSRKKQQVRRPERPAAQHDLAPGLDQLVAALAPVAQARSPLAVEDDARRVRLGDHGQVRPLHRRMQIGRRRRTALAFARPVPELGDLVEPGALLLGAVEIVVAADLGLGAGLDEGMADRTRFLLFADLQRTVAAMQGVAAALIALRPPEIGQHLVP